MKKKLLKLCAIGLAICTIFSCMIFAASAVEEGTESLPKWDYGAISDHYIAPPNNYTWDYYGGVIEYVSVYGRGTVTSSKLVGGTGWSNRPGSLIPRDGDKIASYINTSGPLFDGCDHVNNRPGLAFTAPKTGTVKFTLQTIAWRGEDVNVKVYVGIEGEMKWNGIKSPEQFTNCVTAKPQNRTLGLYQWDVTVDVTAGEKVLFIFGWNSDLSNFQGAMHVNCVEYTSVSSDASLQTSWSFGNVSDSDGLDYANDVVSYVSVHNEGVANATPAVWGYLWVTDDKQGYMPEGDKSYGVWRGSDGPNFANEKDKNEYSLGLSFTANQTGTIEFTLQTIFAQSKSNIYIGIDGKMEWDGNGTFKNCKVYDDHTNTDLHQWTVRVDVIAGEKVLFLVGQPSDDNNSMMLYLSGAKYIAGDLTQNPITFLCEQATKPSEEKFAVRLISAVCRDKVEEGTELGYVITVKHNDTVKVDGQRYALTDEYPSLDAYGANGNKIDELTPLQGTYLTAEVIKNIEGLSAQGTVTIEFSVFAGNYNGPTVRLTYENGVFVSSETVEA